MPDFPTNVSSIALKSVFPIVFDRLLVSMFLSEEGFIDNGDIDLDTIAGSWYGLSWPCIDREIHYVWGYEAREIRGAFYERLWRFVKTLGKENTFTKDTSVLTFLAFFQPWPSIAFGHAAERLIQSGCLEVITQPHPTVSEWEIPMYYPLPELGHRIAESMQQLN